jgi:general stress protein 26
VNKSPDPQGVEAKAKIVELLGENRVMAVSTLRPDGWPQATMVGFVHDDLTLYFCVGRTSQKLANIHHDRRVSIALGHQEPDRLRGLSMAAHAAEVMEVGEIDRLNTLMLARYPEQNVFSPREASAAVIRATPIIVSIIDLARGPGEPDLVTLDSQISVHDVQNEEARVQIRYTRGCADAYRPGAPA